MKRKVIIVDIDGTLANIDHRRHLVSDGNKDWNQFFENMVNDTPNRWCVKLVNSMRPAYFPIFLTGRMSKYQRLTMEFLTYKCGFKGGTFSLMMRKDKDTRKDAIVKQEIYENFIEPRCDVLFVVDGRLQVVEMWRELGLTVLQCAKGDY